jgi:hypothetical protein
MPILSYYPSFRIFIKKGNCNIEISQLPALTLTIAYMRKLNFNPAVSRQYGIIDFTNFRLTEYLLKNFHFKKRT